MSLKKPKQTKKPDYKELTNYSLYNKDGPIFFFYHKTFLINLYKADPYENNWAFSP